MNKLSDLEVGDKVLLKNVNSYIGADPTGPVEATFKGTGGRHDTLIFETVLPLTMHDGDGLCAPQHGYFVVPGYHVAWEKIVPASDRMVTTKDNGGPALEDTPVIPKSAEKATSAMPAQTNLVLEHLLSGRTLTRIQADHLYRVASLSRRICDLEERGHKIKRDRKTDLTGRPYVEYSLRTVPQRKVG